MIAQGHRPGKKDEYWDHPFEIKAEKFGRKEAKKYNIKKLFSESLKEDVYQDESEWFDNRQDNLTKQRTEPDEAGYSEEDYEYEIGSEYFDNEYAQEAIPNLFRDDKQDVLPRMKSAPSRELTDDEIFNIRNSEAGWLYGMDAKDREHKGIDNINFQNWEDYGNRWRYTDKAEQEFGATLPRYSPNTKIDPYDDPENKAKFKQFKTLMHNPEYVEKKKEAKPGEGGAWRDVEGLVSAYKKGAPIKQSLVIRDRKGRIQLLGGNTRLSSAIAAGVRPKVKVIDYDGEFQDNKEQQTESLNEVSAKVKMFKQKLMRRGISIRYDKAKAEKDLIQKYGGKGRIAAKKFGLRKAYYAVPDRSAGGGVVQQKPTIKISKKEMEKLHQDKQIDKGNLRIVFSEGLLLEGGAYGHMAHPFDDKDLTFGDLKKIITDGFRWKSKS